jgi:hypothetical protein
MILVFSVDTIIEDKYGQAEETQFGNIELTQTVENIENERVSNQITRSCNESENDLNSKKDEKARCLSTGSKTTDSSFPRSKKNV